MFKWTSANSIMNPDQGNQIVDEISMRGKPELRRNHSHEVQNTRLAARRPTNFEKAYLPVDLKQGQVSSTFNRVSDYKSLAKSVPTSPTKWHVRQRDKKAASASLPGSPDSSRKASEYQFGHQKSSLLSKVKGIFRKSGAKNKSSRRRAMSLPSSPKKSPSFGSSDLGWIGRTPTGKVKEISPEDVTSKSAPRSRLGRLIEAKRQQRKLIRSLNEKRDDGCKYPALPPDREQVVGQEFPCMTDTTQHVYDSKVDRFLLPDDHEYGQYILDRDKSAKNTGVPRHKNLITFTRSPTYTRKAMPHVTLPMGTKTRDSQKRNLSFRSNAESLYPLSKKERKRWSLHSEGSVGLYEDHVTTELHPYRDAECLSDSFGTGDLGQMGRRKPGEGGNCRTELEREPASPASLQSFNEYEQSIQIKDMGGLGKVKVMPSDVNQIILTKMKLRSPQERIQRNIKDSGIPDKSQTNEKQFLCKPEKQIASPGTDFAAGKEVKVQSGLDIAATESIKDGGANLEMRNNNNGHQNKKSATISDNPFLGVPNLMKKNHVPFSIQSKMASPQEWVRDTDADFKCNGLSDDHILTAFKNEAKCIATSFCSGQEKDGASHTSSFDSFTTFQRRPFIRSPESRSSSSLNSGADSRSNKSYVITRLKEEGFLAISHWLENSKCSSLEGASIPFEATDLTNSQPDTSVESIGFSPREEGEEEGDGQKTKEDVGDTSEKCTIHQDRKKEKSEKSELDDLHGLVKEENSVGYEGKRSIVRGTNKLERENGDPTVSSSNEDIQQGVLSGKPSYAQRHRNLVDGRHDFAVSRSDGGLSVSGSESSSDCCAVVGTTDTDTISSVGHLDTDQNDGIDQWAAAEKMSESSNIGQQRIISLKEIGMSAEAKALHKQTTGVHKRDDNDESSHIEFPGGSEEITPLYQHGDSSKDHTTVKMEIGCPEVLRQSGREFVGDKEDKCASTIGVQSILSSSIDISKNELIDRLSPSSMFGDSLASSLHLNQQDIQTRDMQSSTSSIGAEFNWAAEKMASSEKGIMEVEAPSDMIAMDWTAADDSLADVGTFTVNDITEVLSPPRPKQPESATSVYATKDEEIDPIKTARNEDTASPLSPRITTSSGIHEHVKSSSLPSTVPCVQEPEAAPSSENITRGVSEKIAMVCQDDEYHKNADPGRMEMFIMPQVALERHGGEEQRGEEEMEVIKSKVKKRVSFKLDLTPESSRATDVSSDDYAVIESDTRRPQTENENGDGEVLEQRQVVPLTVSPNDDVRHDENTDEDNSRTDVSVTFTDSSSAGVKDTSNYLVISTSIDDVTWCVSRSSEGDGGNYVGEFSKTEEAGVLRNEHGEKQERQDQEGVGEAGNAPLETECKTRQTWEIDSWRDADYGTLHDETDVAAQASFSSTSEMLRDTPAPAIQELANDKEETVSSNRRKIANSEMYWQEEHDAGESLGDSKQSNYEDYKEGGKRAVAASVHHQPNTGDTRLYNHDTLRDSGQPEDCSQSESDGTDNSPQDNTGAWWDKPLSKKRQKKPASDKLNHKQSDSYSNQDPKNHRRNTCNVSRYHENLPAKLYDSSTDDHVVVNSPGSPQTPSDASAQRLRQQTPQTEEDEELHDYNKRQCETPYKWQIKHESKDSRNYKNNRSLESRKSSIANKSTSVTFDKEIRPNTTEQIKEESSSVPEQVSGSECAELEFKNPRDWVSVETSGSFQVRHTSSLPTATTEFSDQMFSIPFQEQTHNGGPMSLSQFLGQEEQCSYVEKSNETTENALVSYAGNRTISVKTSDRESSDERGEEKLSYEVSDTKRSCGTTSSYTDGKEEMLSVSDKASVLEVKMQQATTLGGDKSQTSKNVVSHKEVKIKPVLRNRKPWKSKPSVAAIGKGTQINSKELVSHMVTKGIDSQSDGGSGDCVDSSDDLLYKSTLDFFPKMDKATLTHCPSVRCVETQCMSVEEEAPQHGHTPMFSSTESRGNPPRTSVVGLLAKDRKRGLRRNSSKRSKKSSSFHEEKQEHLVSRRLQIQDQIHMPHFYTDLRRHQKTETPRRQVDTGFGFSAPSSTLHWDAHKQSTDHFGLFPNQQQFRDGVKPRQSSGSYRHGQQSVNDDRGLGGISGGVSGRSRGHTGPGHTHPGGLSTRSPANGGKENSYPGQNKHLSPPLRKQNVPETESGKKKDPSGGSDDQGCLSQGVSQALACRPGQWLFLATFFLFQFILQWVFTR